MAVKQFAYSEETQDIESKKTSQFIYSLILIFLIPVLVIVNTFWAIYRFQKNTEIQLENETLLVKTVFAGAVSDSLDNEEALQTKINAISQSNTTIEEISVFRPVQDGFQVVADSNEENIGQAYKSLEYTSAWLDDKDMTLSTPQDENGQRSWVVISPLKDSNLEKVALLNLKISIADTDATTQKTINNALITLAVVIFLVLLLLFDHFHFFEYAVLFKRLKEVDKMKDDFISMASHELKTPMAAIKGYISMIFEGVAGKIDRAAKTHLEKVLANIERLDNLVDALLDVSRLEQGRMQFDMQAVDITTVIGSLVSEMKIQADEKKLTLEYEPLDEPHPLIFADPSRLGQVFENVIGNAIKYTFRGGVKICHRVEEDQLKTIVQDTGIGMSKKDMKGLFKRFYRIRNEKTVNIPGTGLGLWITKEITMKMNGNIYAESREGIGSAFVIIFPIVRENKK